MMQWRRWILPLEAARADAEPPLDEAPLVEAAERLAEACDVAFQSRSREEGACGDARAAC